MQAERVCKCRANSSMEQCLLGPSRAVLRSDTTLRDWSLLSSFRSYSLELCEYMRMAQHEDSPRKHTKGNLPHHSLVAQFDNPCEKEQDLSYKCLHDNGFDKDKCSLAFANYQACKDFWNRIRAERRAKGIYPYMPCAEDRKIILDKYRNQKS